MSRAQELSVLFVCMGNICRSPVAECLFQDVLKAKGIAHQFYVDSAGTGGWHTGSQPDSRMRAVARRENKHVRGKARQVTVEDLEQFDWVFCMDQDNYDTLLAMGANPQKTNLLLPFVGYPSPRDVPDPYYGDDDGFEHVLHLIDDAVHQLANTLS